MNLRQALALSIKTARKRRHLSQEAFSIVSSRTYLSSLERGLKSPTFDKLDEIAGVINIHPASLVLAAYGAVVAMADSQATLERVFNEAQELLRHMSKSNSDSNFD